MYELIMIVENLGIIDQNVIKMWENVLDELLDSKDRLNLVKVWNFIRTLIKWKGERIKRKKGGRCTN